MRTESRVLTCEEAHPNDQSFHPGGHVIEVPVADIEPGEDGSPSPVVQAVNRLTEAVEAVANELRRMREGL